MATIGDVATAISLIGKVIKVATDAQMMKKEFKELADYLELVGRQLEMLDDRELDDASLQTFQKVEEVLLQCHDLANSCQQRSSIYIMVKGKQIQNELRGAQEKVTKYLTLIPLIHFTQIFKRLKEEETKINGNLKEHARDESDIPDLAAERIAEVTDTGYQKRIAEVTDNGYQSNAHLFTYKQRITHYMKRLFTKFEPVISTSHDNNFTVMPWLSFTYAQIVKMTLDFKTIINIGGFGKVYHGRLEDGTDIAIKLQTDSSERDDMQFFIELRSLTRVHHTNIISLIGYCKDGSHHAIVYEYMPRGSLQDNLRGKAGFPVLTWAQRLQIACQAAQGLDYLHTGCNPPIIHRDVKSSNILLGADLEAKITDFGISRAWNENDTDEATTVVGSRGYLDPEYYKTGRVSKASDVYGFGIILLEMITGQPPLILDSEVRQHIVQWVSLRVASGADFVDTSMNKYYDLSSVRTVLQLALSCADSSASRRPRMAEVAIQLQEIIEMKPFDGQTNQSNHTVEYDNMENEEVKEARAELHIRSVRNLPWSPTTMSKSVEGADEMKAWIYNREKKIYEREEKKIIRKNC